MQKVKTQFGVGAGKCSIGRSAAKSHGNVRDFYITGEWYPVYRYMITTWLALGFIHRT